MTDERSDEDSEHPWESFDGDLEKFVLPWPSEDFLKRYGAGVFSVGHIERVTEDATGLYAEGLLTTDAFKRNEFSIYMEDLSSLHWYGPTDTPFRDYTPFPRLDAAERKARAFTTEARARIGGAWKVLREGDRDPFGRGCDCW